MTMLFSRPLSLLAVVLSAPVASAFVVNTNRVISTKLHVAADPPLFVDATAPSDKDRRSQVSDYYGSTLATSEDLKTNACSTAGAPPGYIQQCLSNIHPEVIAKYYGCGLCLPSYDMTGASVLDLGCGAGRDVYIASQLVGENGKVVGIDMTQEQLDVAEKHLDYHAEKFGYAKSNVEFKKGVLEELDQLNLPDSSFDVIISNCVINLCTDKEAVLRECRRLLKPGGEMYFSDVYSNRRIPQDLQNDEVLWGECLTGALYWNDFENLARKVGFADPRLVEDAPITIKNQAVQDVIADAGQGGMQFYSATYRLWNIDELEPYCEDYGQALVYKGTLPRHQSGFLLDKHHYFETGRVHPVCGNSYRMVHDVPMLRDHFEFIGTWDTHFGIFEGCGSALPYDAVENPATLGTKGSSSSSSGGGGGGGCC